MANPLLIAVHGLPGCGKDTFADTLIKNGNFVKVSFAAPLKRGLSTMFNIPMEDIENPNIKNEPNYKFGRSIRYMAQTLGTEWGRNLVNDNVWLDIATDEIGHKWANGFNVVNTDLRFDNEAKRIKDLGGYIIHIIRDNNEHNDLQSTTGVKNHQSNLMLDEQYIDYTLHNSSTLNNFYDNVLDALNYISNKHFERVLNRE